MNKSLVTAGLASVLLLSGGIRAESQELRTIRLEGRVLSGNKGVAGVAVTDGRTIVETDRYGRYALPSTTEAEFVYITVPDGYAIPATNGTPSIYQSIGRSHHYDFSLNPCGNLTRHRLLVWADPQVYFDEELDSCRRAAADVGRTIADSVATFGIVCGDIIGDINRQPHLFEPIRSIIAESGVPFFYAIGNHDLDLDARTNDGARRSFKHHFGPTYYSFDRGQIHYVVLDDIFFIARSYLYVGYLEEQQLRWLEQDLARIEAGRSVIICMHIPSWSQAARNKNWSKEESNKILNNRNALYTILKPYRVHLLTAHEHYNENYTPTSNITEHVHAPLSTLFWQAPRSMDGIPAGYGVYEIDGDSICWHYKAVDYPASRQFTAYAVGKDRHHPNDVTVNVWNYGPKWRVCWYEDGVYRGEMEQYTGYDESIYDYVTRYSDRFRHKYIGAALTEHLFRATPSSSEAKIRIEVYDPFNRCSTWESPDNYIESKRN